MQRLLLNSAYPGLELLHRDPPVYRIASFIPARFCEKIRHAASPRLQPSTVVDLSAEERGKGGIRSGGGRDSSSMYMHHQALPTLLARCEKLLGLPRTRFEYPQITRYLPTQQYTSHNDAIDLSTEAGQRMSRHGGQRIATLLVYLNTCESGGETHFQRLGLRVRPLEGSCVVFFPAFSCGTIDPLMQHSAEPAIEEKWVAQLWARQRDLHPRQKIEPEDHASYASSS